MLRGNDKCPLGKFKGIKLMHVPKAVLREFLINPTIGSLFPDLIAYADTQFSNQEKIAINDERLTAATLTQNIDVRSTIRDMFVNEMARDLDNSISNMTTVFRVTTNSPPNNTVLVSQRGNALIDSNGNLMSVNPDGTVGYRVGVDLAIPGSERTVVSTVERRVKEKVKVDTTQRDAFIKNDRSLEI
jgi:hypothetical protein